MATSKKRLGKSKPKPSKDDKRAKVFEVCDLLRRGNCSIRKACEQVGIAITTLHDWGNSTPELAEHYARAREEGLTIDADSIEELAATPCTDQLEAASIKLQVDTRKWLLSKRLPKVYGDRVAHVGDSTADPIKVEQAIGPILPTTDDLLKGIEKLRDLANEHFGDK
jgi:hypothetical protein